MRYKLPAEVQHLVHARNELRRRYTAFGLKFTPDGNLVGDLGEAIAAELFDLKLAGRRGLKGVDAYTKEPTPRSVQIKASGRGESLIFTHTDAPADLLIGLVLRYDDEEVEVVYNGPYDLRLFGFDALWQGQRAQRINRFRKWNANVPPERRLTSTFQPLP